MTANKDWYILSIKNFFKRSLLILLSLVVCALLFLFIVIITYEDNNSKSTSRYNFQISGQQDLFRRYNIDFDKIFNNKNDILDIVNKSNRVAEEISPGAKLMSICFVVNKNESNVNFTDINLSYYLSLKNKHRPRGRMDISLFLPNESINYSVTGYFPHYDKEIGNMIPDNIISGDYLDPLLIERKLKEQNIINGSYFVHIDCNKDIHISQQQ